VIVTAIRARTLPTIKAARTLIERAVEATHYLGTTPQDFYSDIERRIAEDALGVFLGLNGAEIKAVAIGMLPTSPLMMGAQVPLAYSEDHELSKLVGRRLRDWCVANGHKRCFSMNLNDTDDRAYCRVWKYVGKSEVIGSIVETKFSGA
jgi:hypothetical protein